MQQIIELIFAPHVVNNDAAIGFAIGSKLEGVFLLDHFCKLKHMALIIVLTVKTVITQ